MAARSHASLSSYHSGADLLHGASDGPAAAASRPGVLARTQTLSVANAAATNGTAGAAGSLFRQSNASESTADAARRSSAEPPPKARASEAAPSRRSSDTMLPTGHATGLHPAASSSSMGLSRSPMPAELPSQLMSFPRVASAPHPLSAAAASVHSASNSDVLDGTLGDDGTRGEDVDEHSGDYSDAEGPYSTAASRRPFDKSGAYGDADISAYEGLGHEVDVQDHDTLMHLLAELSKAYDDEDPSKDPLDSARPELAANMGRTALEAVLRNVTFVVSTKLWGSFGVEDMSDAAAAAANAASRVSNPELEAAEKARAEAEARRLREKKAAERAHAERKKKEDAAKAARDNKKNMAKQLSPLVIQERQKQLEREAKREAARAQRRAKQLEKERISEERERKAMLEEEWYQERVKWAKNWGGREGGWKTVRVFISSTFTDMHGERDSLTRAVFPELNNRCKHRRVRVVPVDLRWGLTAEDTSDTGLGALEHCLLEVDHSRPYFIVLHGERYGWIPPNYRVSDRPEFDWIRVFEPAHSITDMEIQYGFLRKPCAPVHAFLYRRDPAFMDQIPLHAPERRIFAFDYSDNAEVRDRRDKLRIEMEEHPYCRTRTYVCNYGGLDDEGKPHVNGLDRFEQQVLEDLQDAIFAEFPPPPPPRSELEVERSFHTHFVEDRSRGFIGRVSLMNDINRWVHENPHDKSLPLIVVGTPGSGKTSLITAFAKQFMVRERNVFTLVHVVSASPSSTDIREVLLRMCRELAFEYSLEFSEDDLDEYQAVKEAFTSLLFRAADAARARAADMATKDGTVILILIDAINQLNPYNGAYSMDWFPPYTPPGVRAIMTCVHTQPDHECLMALAKRDPRPPQMEVPGLSPAEKQEIVRLQLSEYRKKLTKYQLQLLMEKKESNKPLFLLTACEELRLQAQYGFEGKGVDDKIRELPGEIPTLLDVVLERVERDLAAWAKTSAAQALLPEPLPSSSAAAATAASPSGGTADAARAAAAVKDDAADREARKRAAVRGRRGSKPPEDDDGDDDLAPSEKELGDKIFNDDLTDPDQVGKQLVKKALTLIQCSRRGLQENELLELLAPRGKKVLPTIVWARLYRSLELYLHPTGEEENGMLGFFSQQMVHAVRKRYLQQNRLREAEVSTRLADYFMAKADPSRDGMYLGENKRYFEDLVYYHLRALKIDTLKRILGSLIFIECRARRGPTQMEFLLRDYYMAQEEIRGLKLAVLKNIMTKDEFQRFSRSALLSWIAEYQVFVGSLHTALSAYPSLTFQYALNQPDISGPHAEGGNLLSRSTARIMERMDKRERLALDKSEAAIWALLCNQYQNLLSGGTLNTPPVTPMPDPSVPSTSDPTKRASLGSVATTKSSASTGNLPAVPASRVSAAGRGGKAATGAAPAPMAPTPTSASAAAAAAAATQALAEAAAIRRPEYITDPAAWLAACAKEFASPKTTLIPLIANYLTMTPMLVTGGAANAAALQPLVTVFVNALAAQVTAAQAAAQEAYVAEAAAAAAANLLPPTQPSPPSFRSVLYMSREESRALGIPSKKLRQIRSALAENLATLSLGIPVDIVPRRFLEWVNKPQRNRIVADFAGLHSQVTCLVLAPDAAMIALGFKSSHVHLIDAGTGELVRELVANGHTEGITTLAFSGDGLRLASGSHDNLVIIWDALTGTRLSSVSVHQGSVTAAIWLDADSGPAIAGTTGGGAAQASKKRGRRGNRMLLSASMEGDIRISQEKSRLGNRSDAAEGQEMRYDIIWSKDFMSSPVLCMAFNANTEVLVGGHGDGDITAWDAHAPNLGLIELCKWKAHRFSSVMTLDFSPDGVLLASGGMDSVLRIWRRHVLGADVVWREEPSTQGEKSGGGHSAQITSVHFSPDGTKLLTSGLDMKLILWEVESGTEILSMSGHAAPIYASNFLGVEGRVVSASYDKTVKLWDIGGIDDRRLSAPVRRAGIHSFMGVRAGGRPLRGGRGGTAASSVNLLRDALHPEGAPEGVALASPSSSPSGPLPTTTAAGGSKTFFPEPGRGGALAGRRSMLAGRRALGVRAMAFDEQLNPHAPAGAHGDRVLAAVVSRDGKVAVTGAADREIKVWDIAKGQEQCVLLGHNASITALCLMADQKLLFSGDASGQLLIWDGMTFDHILTLSVASAAITCITYAVVTEPPPGVLSRGIIVFVGTADGHVSAWNSDTGNAWELQPEADSATPLHKSAVKSIQYIQPTLAQVPATCKAAPVESGVFPEHIEELRRMEHKARKDKTANDSDAMSVAGSAADESIGGRSSDARKRGGGRGSSLTRGGAKAGRRAAPTGAGRGNTAVAAEPSIGAGMAPAAAEAPPNPYRVERVGAKSDPAVTVEGGTPANNRPRVASIGADGRLVVQDLFTMQILHEDAAPSDLGTLGSAAISADGTRIALGSSMPAARVPVLVTPATSLSRGQAAVLEDPSQRMHREASRDKRKPADAQRPADSISPADARKLAQEKAREKLERWEAKKKRMEEKRAARKAERERARAAAGAKKKNRKPGAEGEDAPADDEVVSEDDDDDDVSDDDEEEAAAPASDAAKASATAAAAEEEAHNDKTCASLGISCDGTLLAVGCSERLLSVLDLARPNTGPLVQFLALGEVTAVAVGPGIFPWLRGPAPSSTYSDKIAELARGSAFSSVAEQSAITGIGEEDENADEESSSDSDAEPYSLGSSGGAFAALSAPTPPVDSSARRKRPDENWDALRFHASTVGDGEGHLGIIMAGDSTGAVFILRVTDVLRRTEAERERKVLELEAKRRAEAEARARAELEAKQKAEEERKRQESLKAKMRPPIETLEFPNGNVASAALPPRAMFSDVAADRELAIDMLRTFGVKFDDLVLDEIAGDDSELLVNAAGLGASGRPQTTAGAMTGAAPAPPPAPAAKAPAKPVAAAAPSALTRSKTLAPATTTAASSAAKGRKPGVVTVAEEEVEPEVDAVDEENSAKLTRLVTLREDIWQRPRCLIGVFGGAGGLHDLLVPNLRRLIKRGAVAAAIMSGGMILDGGTAAGVMDMIGQSVAGAEPKTMRILGVCPEKLIMKPNEKSSDPTASPLEPNHSNFVLVPSSDWGGETSTMFTFASVLSTKIPCASVLANGGMISKKEILNAVRHKIPVVVIEGSGRLADSIARALRRRDETPPEEFEPEIYIPDSEVREIVMTGDIHLYSVTAHGDGLRAKLLDLLSQQRDRLLLTTMT